MLSSSRPTLFNAAEENWNPKMPSNVRRKLARAFKFIALAFLVLAVLAVLVGAWLFYRARPQVDGTLEVAGLTAPVEVVRDRWGVPHLFAANERDLFFAQGYVHAQDRLWQMHFNRTVASGRLSSLFGPGPLDADRYLRTVGLRRAAERDLPLLSADTRAILQAYADGVNAYLASHRGKLPIEFTLLGVKPEPWTPIDSLAWSRMMSFNLSLNSQLEISRAQLVKVFGLAVARQLVPPYPADAPVIVPEAGPQAGLPAPLAVSSLREDAASPLEQGLLSLLPSARRDQIWGSNAWVVHGSRTATGKPLLANDTHLGLSMPSTWYEIGLHGGRFDCVGFSLAGLPLVVMGQNRRIAWGVTNLNADVQDLYVERLDNAENPRRAWFQGRWEELKREREEIPVKGGSPVTLEVLSTRHGPLVNTVLPPAEPGAPRDPQPLALRWAALEGSRLVDAISAADRASNWGEFRQAMSQWDTPSLNFVYADVDGNIGYQSTAKVPIRVAGHDGTVPVEGWSGRAEWRGFIPFEEMPHALNPAAGYVATANHKVVPDSYPYLLTMDYASPDRARRLNVLLSEQKKFTVDDMRALQADVLSQRSAGSRQRAEVIQPQNEVEKAALDHYRKWDLRYDVDSIGATINSAWEVFLTPAIFDELERKELAAAKPLVFSQPEMIDVLLQRPNDPWFDDRRTPAVETRDDILRRSFSEAIAWLREQNGDDPRDWRWGSLHRVSFTHQPFGMAGIAPLEWIFNSRVLEVAGESDTVNSNGSDPRRPFRTGFGVSQRFIADLADLGRSVAVNSTGQSEHPFHRHRNDLAVLWSRGEYHPVLTTREAAGAHAESVLTLTPAAER
jgi:penicillin amidase